MSYSERLPLNISQNRPDYGDESDIEQSIEIVALPAPKSSVKFILVSSLFMFGLITVGFVVTNSYYNEPVKMRAAWSSKAEPFSTVDPTTLGFRGIQRPWPSTPGPVFGDLLIEGAPLPTNSWYENFLLGSTTIQPENKVFQVPYILDAAGPIPGLRSHPCHVQSNSKSVMMTYEYANGVTLGAVEALPAQYTIHSQGQPAITKLAIELEWKTATETSAAANNKPYSMMRSPIVRGAPYTSMIYFNSTPRIYTERILRSEIIIDNGLGDKHLECGNGKGNYSDTPVEVTREMKLIFDSSDMTWLVFVSQPTTFVCSMYDATIAVAKANLPPGVVDTTGQSSFFDLKAISPFGVEKPGMIRLAMSNNCTNGINPQYCSRIDSSTRYGRDQSEFEALLRNHADVYPTAKADIEFTFPVEPTEEEELRMIFNWHPSRMSLLANNGETAEDDHTNSITDNEDGAGDSNQHNTDPLTGREVPGIELLMFALPHHQERMRRTEGSSNQVLVNTGCLPTIHGLACVATGGSWSLIEHAHRLSFSAKNAMRTEMLGDLKASALLDLDWRIPPNYMLGAGDTYFSGKLLARLGRILIIADELGFNSASSSDTVATRKFLGALNHLQAGVEIWLNGSAESPFLYDHSWGGVVMCGCDYHWTKETGGHCLNDRFNCPALSDQGQNFGAGFYNDHHYHFGYHIYAAAVLSKFRPTWAKQYHQHVLLLVRDIANPSDKDPFFPTFRHKDWYLGHSWASGIVTIGSGKPYPNGRNQESVSEAIAAYEAIALYADVMVNIFAGTANREELVYYDSALRMREMGRLLMATEVRAALTYWHVQAPDTPGVARIYPSEYTPKIVGMMWSMLVQEQTWFGNEAWKSYGIQLMPITVAAEMRDEPNWVAEMLPAFQESCFADPICLKEGWTALIFTSMATVGQWKAAWKGVMALNRTTYYDTAGANGHSQTNTLWYIATRDTNIQLNTASPTKMLTTMRG